jgi:hypothetical protein
VLHGETMIVAAPSPRPAARSRRAAAYALAALTFVLAFLGATSDGSASAHAAIGAIKLHASADTITRSPANVADPVHRDPAARFADDGPEEKADLGGRGPTPTSVLRSRGDRGWDGKLPELVLVDPAAHRLALSATAALLDCASVARIAALHERAVQITTPHEPNPARGPPLL